MEEGPVQFGSDWPGIFIRGDAALAYSQSILQYLRDPTDLFARAVLKGLADTLASCEVKPSKPVEEDNG